MGDPPAVKEEVTVKHETINLKPGQKYPTPTPGVAERIFYETLYHQKPDSPMAQEWCVLYGVLPDEDAARINKLVQKRKLEGKSGSMSSPAPKKAPASSKSRKARLDDDVSVDTGLGESSLYEGVGTAGV